MFPVTKWFVAWIAGSILFLSIPLTAIAFAYWRNLAAAGVARRATLMLAQARALVSPRSEVTNEPQGPVFCKWEVRWGSSGSGVGTATMSEQGVSVIVTAGNSIGRALTFAPEYRRGSVVYGRVNLADGTSGRGALLGLAV